jgi:predicted TIM-barrel fold metal-dependent hydrolase
VCEVARTFGVPVLYDVMGEVSVAELLAREYPDVPFVIPHLGSFSDDWAAQSAFVERLGRHPNLYTDTSGVRRFDLLERAVTQAGPSKVLFGSDGPWLHPGVELAKIRLLGLDPRAEQLILGDNAARLLAPRTSRAQNPPLAVARGRPPAATDPWAPHASGG